MKSVVLNGLEITECMIVINHLRNNGFQQGIDFDFEYHPRKYNNDGWESVSPRHIIFHFYNDSNATYFALRWGHMNNNITED